MSLKVNRRELLKYMAIFGASAVVASCAPEPEVVEEPEEVEEIPEEEAEPAPKEEITLRYMDRSGQLGDFMRHASRLYEERNPHITIKNESAGWQDLAQKVPTMVAGGTMADLAFQHAAYMLPTLAAKGVWLDMTPAAERDNHDFSIYYEWALETCRQGPNDELVAMPMGIHAGQNELHWNVEMFEEMGIEQPHKDMSKQEVLEMLTKVQEQLPEGSFATDFLFGSHFTSECHARSWGGYIVGPEREKCGFNLPETQEALRWGYDLIHEYGVVPTREEVQESNKAMFYAETMATFLNCSANVWVGFEEAIEGRFTLGHCTWPHAEDEGWGTVPSCDATVIYGETDYPDEAWGLAALLSSFEISKYTALETQMTPGAVIEAWNDPEVGEVNPPYKNCAEAWEELEDVGNIGIPANTRRKEFDDHFDSEWQKIMYGEVEYTQEAVDQLQEDLQAIMDKDLP